MILVARLMSPWYLVECSLTSSITSSFDTLLEPRLAANAFDYH